MRSAEELAEEEEEEEEAEDRSRLEHKLVMDEITEFLFTCCNG